MFDAFTSILREKLKRIRTVLRTYYNINIRDPTQTSYKALNKAIGDFIRLEELECYSNSYIAYIG
jgi:hypothetical protein